MPETPFVPWLVPVTGRTIGRPLAERKMTIVTIGVWDGVVQLERESCGPAPRVARVSSYAPRAMKSAVPARFASPEKSGRLTQTCAELYELERFRAKWTPVRVKKTRQNKNLELRF